MKEEGDEPDDVDGKYPPLAECEAEKQVRIVLECADAEHLGKLHLCPEVSEVEEDDTEDDDSEDNHVGG